MNSAGKINIVNHICSKLLPGRIIFGGVILVYLVISGICVVNFVKLVHKPFPGFLVNERLLIVLRLEHWSGARAGVSFPDKILKANNETINSVKDLDRVIKSTNTGEQVRYSIERDGQVIEVEVATMPFSWNDLLINFGIDFFSAIIYLLIGLIVFILKPDTKVSWSFFLCCLFLSLTSILSFDNVSTHKFREAYFLVTIFLPGLFLHLSLNFPGEKRFIRKFPYIEWVPYFLSMVLFILMESSYPGPLFTKIQRFLLIYVIISMVGILSSTLHAYLSRSSALARQRAKVVLFGVIIAFPVPASMPFLNFIGVQLTVVQMLTTFSSIPLLFFPAAIAYAIARHNLFDVDVYIKRAVGYVIMTIIVGMAYFAVQTVMSAVILKPVLGDGAEKLYPVIFAILVVFFFNPLNRTIQGWVDRIFYRKKFDYKETIVSVSNALASVLDLNEVINQIIHTVRKEMFVDAAGIILMEPKKRACQTFFVDDRSDKTGIPPGSMTGHEREMSITYDDPLLTLLSGEKKLITRYDIEENPHYSGLREVCVPSFSRIGASLALPLIYQNEVTGILTLGTKKSGHFYTREDIELLSTLASHGAVAIENARLFRENLDKGRMEEELKIAHDIQMSMLPEKAPEIEGFEIAGKSIPAKEVGGDFYDFIEIGDGETKRLGIVIGDVTGKGVSGALMMAASRSTYRILADEHSSVAEMMSVGNNRLNKDIRKGMFVALIYAVLDPMEKTILFSNAGQTQPIMCPGDNTKPFYIDTEGDRFPLGIIKDCQYQEKRLTVKKGDTVVFYTDGVVEAMNGQGEMYGFERFMSAIDEGRRFSADMLLDKLMQRISLYAGDVEQHDDITIVVVRVK